ncbi:hypothetical protein D3C81_1997550 [compost metagenome]
MHRSAHLTFVQSGQRIAEGRIENIRCRPTQIAALVCRARILRELFSRGGKGRFTALNISRDLLQFQTRLLIGHDRRRFQQDMAGMNFRYGDALALATHIVDFQNVEADT